MQEYFNSLQVLPSQNKELIKKVTQHKISNIENLINTGKLKIPDISTTFESLKNQPHANIVEHNVISSKIKHVEKYKQDLKLKLLQLDESLNNLKPKLKQTSPDPKSREKKQKIDPAKELEAKALIQKLKDEKKKFTMSKKARILHLEAKKKALLNQKENQKPDFDQKKLEKIKKIELKIKEIMARKEDRIKNSEKYDKELKEKYDLVCLHEKLEKKFEEKQTKKLEIETKKLKNIFKRIPEYNLNEHDQKFIQQEKEKEEIRKVRKENYLKEMKSKKSQFPSKIFKSLESIRIEETEKQRLLTQLSKEKIKKHKEFYQEIKEKFLPKIDENKRKELQDLRESIIKPKKQKQDSDPYKLGLSYLKFAKDHKKNTNSQSPNTTVLKNDSFEKTTVKNYNKNTIREITEKLHLSKKPDFWKKIDKKSSLNYLEKAQRIRQEADLLERKAREKERTLHKKINTIPDQEDDVNDLLMNSIQAKLRLLS